MEQRGGVMDESLKALAERYFFGRLKNIALADAEAPERTEEIRLYSGKEAAVVKKSGIYFISESGECVARGRGAVFSPSEIREIVKMLCDNSIYSSQDKLKNGFLSLEGGHRAGVTGRCVTENNRITHITDISSVNIRIAREVRGAALKIINYIAQDTVKNTLIISPPGCGKTTMLRDTARLLGGERCMKRVAVADERGELAALKGGIPMNDVGALTSVLDSCPKYEGMMSLLRSSSPEVMITDEIGSESDAEAVMQAVKSGVAVICSAHAATIDGVKKRAGIKKLCDEGVFEAYILLSRRCGPGTVEEIRYA